MYLLLASLYHTRAETHIYVQNMASFGVLHNLWV